MTNKELDKCMAKIMGFPIDSDGYVLHGGGWQPTEFISDAFQVVEKNIDNPRLQFSGLQLIKGQTGYFWQARYYNGQTMYQANADSPSLAICLAVKEASEFTLGNRAEGT